MSTEVVGVDVHAHAIPTKFLDDAMKTKAAGVEIEKTDKGYVVQYPGVKALRPIGGNQIRFNDRLSWLDDESLKHQVVAPWLDIMGQVLSPAEGNAWVRNLNNALAEAVKESDGRLLAHTSLHLGDPQSAAKELERAHGELDMKGCMIPTNIDGGLLSESRFDAIWEAAEALQTPIMLHPPTVAPSECVFADFPESAFYGRLIDTTVVASQLIVSGVFDRFPNLRLVLVHGGGFLPYQSGRFDSMFSEIRIGPNKLMPVEYVKKFFFDTVLMSESALRCLVDLVGAGHVMIGSDHAAQPSEKENPKLTAAIEAIGLGQSDEQLIVHENAESLYRI